MSSLKENSKVVEQTYKSKETRFVVNMDLNDTTEVKGKKWTKEEDELLVKAVSTFEEKNWLQIASMLKERTPSQCLQRWKRILLPGIVKGPWTYHEDRKLLNWIKSEGPTKWASCASTISGRSGKQCRERWFNALDPKVKKGEWTIEEDFAIYLLYSKHGGKWATISLNFIERTENSIKNRFYSSLRKRHSEWKKINDKKGINIDKKTLSQDSSSQGIDDLLKYLPTAIELTGQKLMKKNHYRKEELEALANQIIEKSMKLVNVKKIRKQRMSAKEKALSSSVITVPNVNNIKNEELIEEKTDTISDDIDDLELLEKEINQICECPDITDDKTNLNSTIKIEELLQTNLLNSQNPFPYVQNVNDSQQCEEKKDDIYGYILGELKSLESLVMSTKSELLKYTNANKEN